MADNEASTETPEKVATVASMLVIALCDELGNADGLADIAANLRCDVGG